MFGFFKKKPEASKPSTSQIVPRIKHTNFLAAVKSMGASPDETPVTEPLIADLLITYAFDLPGSFQMVSPNDCRNLGIGEEKLRGIAVENLKKQLGKIGFQGKQPLQKVMVGNDLEACLLLVDDFWSQLAGQIPPEIVVGVPARDVLLVSTSSSPDDGLKRLRELTVQAHAKGGNHNLTTQLLVRQSHVWEVFDTP
jgi:uncharacterized protein YtpQ (UPF0354 family)